MRFYFMFVAVSFLMSDVVMADQACDPLRSKKVFNKCKACHSLDPEKGHMVGPNLFGLMGRKAGTAKGYKYSKAMKASNILWDIENIAKFISNPKTVVPKTKMAFSGLKKQKDREALQCLFRSQEREP